jgi:glycosyltransferase involved in cell wall biosynthesis
LLSLPEATVARRLGLPVVMYVHEMPAPGAKAAASLRWAARVADVLVGGAGAVVHVLRRFAGRTPVLLVYEAAPGVAARRQATDAWTVGTIGTVGHRKGTDVFLETARLVHEGRPEIRFEHAGAYGLSGDDAFEARVRSLAEPLVARGVVRMLGWQPSLEVLGRWSLFLLPSRGELFPLTTLEAMGSGVPVVATRVGGLPEQIADGRTGLLVPPEDPAALAEAVVRLYDDQRECARLGAAGADHVRGRFTLEQQASGLHRAYLGALNLRFAPPLVSRTTRRALEEVA